MLLILSWFRPKLSCCSNGPMGKKGHESKRLDLLVASTNQTCRELQLPRGLDIVPRLVYFGDYGINEVVRPSKLQEDTNCVPKKLRISYFQVVKTVSVSVCWSQHEEDFARRQSVSAGARSDIFPSVFLPGGGFRKRKCLDFCSERLRAASDVQSVIRSISLLFIYLFISLFLRDNVAYRVSSL